MNKEAKAMKYAIEPIATIARSDMISDGGTEEKAKALEGQWLRVNERDSLLVEENTVTRVYISEDEVGCTCDAFRNSSTNVLCEHILAFGNLEGPPQQTIESPEYRWLRTYLFSLGWYSENGYVYPSLDEGEQPPEVEVVAELPPMQEPAKLDPVNEERPLDVGVVEDTKTYERKCQHCGHVESGEDLAEVKHLIDEHRETCTKNPANRETTPPEQTQEPTVSKSETVENPPKEEGKKVNTQSKKTVTLFDWIENLIEFGVGQIFGDTGAAKTGFCREVAEQASDEGKKVVYWDTEGNMTRAQRAAMAEHKNITYILDRDWAHIQNMLSSELSKGSPKLGKCDLFILDSIGVPVLGIYGTLKQNQKGNALQAMQGLLYELTKFAEINEAVVIVTNQPVSEMNKTKEEIADRHPFGDKAMFFTKEILKIAVTERTEYKTTCHIRAWRSRSAGRGKLLCTVTVSDNGVEVTPA